jgi:biotin carboxyl carrier protein
MVEQFMLTVDGTPYSIEIKGDQITVNGYALSLAGKAQADSVPIRALDEEAIQINGLVHTVELIGSQAIVDGIAYSFEVEWPADDQEVTSARGAPPLAPRPRGDEGGTSRARGAGAEDAERGAAGAVKAIMPGKIVRVLVQEGDEVKAGQVVAILEAMKMENELAAPAAGRVQQVLVKPGATVEQGQSLVVIA